MLLAHALRRGTIPQKGERHHQIPTSTASSYAQCTGSSHIQQRARDASRAKRAARANRAADGTNNTFGQELLDRNSTAVRGGPADISALGMYAYS